MDLGVYSLELVADNVFSSIEAGALHGIIPKDSVLDIPDITIGYPTTHSSCESDKMQFCRQKTYLK